MIKDQTFEGYRENLNQANKLSRTYAVLLDALNRHRGKGQQKVTSAPSPCQNPHSRCAARSPAAPPARYLLTRFRALALFGRRPPERVDSTLPASENLHSSGLMQCSKDGRSKRLTAVQQYETPNYCCGRPSTA